MVFPSGRFLQGKDAGAEEHVSQWPPYPPPGETDLEKALRLEEESEAKRVSDEIDHELEIERQTTRKKQKGEKRLLILGAHSLRSFVHYSITINAGWLYLNCGS